MNYFAELIRHFVKVVDKAIDDAGGDPIEAMHGHQCGADCWHNVWVGLEKPLWLAEPSTSQTHAFPESIAGRFTRRRRSYSACGRVFLTEPLYLAAREGQCEECAAAIEMSRAKYREKLGELGKR